MNSLRSQNERLGGWGRYPVEDCSVYRPDRRAQMVELVRDAPEASLIPRGLGRSYGDASLNAAGAVLLSERMDRFLEFDSETGILRCESATSLAEIIETFVPRGFFIPVTPGSKSISLGGAIAADVHGKNHHRDGSIGAHLLALSLLTASGEILECSREENHDVFWATLGGMGLTGVILDATLRLRPIETAYMQTRTEKTRDLADTLERMQRADRDYGYSVAWIDCMASGRKLGRSVLFRAEPAGLTDLPEAFRSAPLRFTTRRRPAIPFDLPSWTLNRITMSAFNSMFYAVHRDGEAIQPLDDYFYPLDAIPRWNRIYGSRGVLQYQILLPMQDVESALTGILEEIARQAGGSFLAVLKSMGPSNEAPLSFAAPGMTLALDFPHTGAALIEHLRQLDERVLKHGGRVYLAKDSCLRPEHLRPMYPRLGEFQAIKHRIDPERRFDSSLARRLRFWDDT